MAGEEGTSGVGSMDEGVGRSWTEEAKHQFGAQSTNGGWSDRRGGGGFGHPISSDGLRTYKRRKKMVGSSSGSFFDKSSFEESANKSAEQAVKEPEDCFPKSRASPSGVMNDSSQQWKISILQQMYHSLKEEGGIKGCIKEALMMTESYSYNGNRCKRSPQKGSTCVGNSFVAEGNLACNGYLGTQSFTITEMCQRAFLKILLSEKFTLLCKLFYENFQEINPENLFGLSLLNRRMKEGAYEHSPLLFSSDIQQLWKELQKIGTDLVSLSKSLSDVSRLCINEQVGGLAHCCSMNVKHEFGYQKSDSRGKPEQMETCDLHQVRKCMHCGDEADTMDCLVCDSCEEMYHVSCIEPAIREIPPSWYCVSCAASGFGTESPHENCVVCERVNATRDSLKQTHVNIRPTDTIPTDCEETSSYSMHDGFEKMPGSSGLPCKFCGSEVEDGEKIKICAHSSCPYKYFHVRCLTKKHLKSYGPRWYCPSCLCRTCLMDKDDDKILLCDSCDNAYHTFCLNPPLPSIPQGKWFCRQCEVNLQIIRRAKKAYEELELKRKQQDSEKGRGGMDMLLSAALKCEEGLSAASQVKR